MNALLDHVWGRSHAQDCVWAHVTGLAPTSAVGRFLMALKFQAFIDDSSTPNGEFVLAGHIASAESWANFAKEWEALLPSGTIAKNDKRHFKMSEMAMTPERMERVPAFYWIIEKHVLASISCRMNLAEFANAKKRIEAWCAARNWAADFDRWNNPFYFLFRCLIDKFHNSREQMEPVVPLTEKVDFIFDNQTEKSFILSAWDEYLDARQDNVRDYYGAHPRFEDDQLFLPLQAADLWAWQVREWYEEDATDLPTKMEAFDFGKWRGKIRPSIAISFNEEHIVKALEALAVENFARAIRERDLFLSP